LLIFFKSSRVVTSGRCRNDRVVPDQPRDDADAQSAVGDDVRLAVMCQSNVGVAKEVENLGRRRHGAADRDFAVAIEDCGEPRIVNHCDTPPSSANRRTCPRASRPATGLG